MRAILLAFARKHLRVSDAAAVLGREGARKRAANERERVKAKARELRRELGLDIPEVLR